MRNQFPYLRTSRGSFVVVLLVVSLVGGWLLAPDGHSQAPAATTSDAIVANQTKIEAQTALLKENLRQAKIYAARGGSGHR